MLTHPKTVERAPAANEDLPDPVGSMEEIGFFERIFFFILPCLSLFEIALIGRLFLSEIVILTIFPFLLIRKGRMLREPVPRTVIILGILWLFSQIVTDLIRITPFEDYSRGWSKIAFFMINFSVLYMLLYQKRRRINHFALGIVGYIMLLYFFNPSTAAVEDWWKFGLGVPLALLTVMICQTGVVRKRPFLPTFLMIMYAALSIQLGSRSLGGICFLIGAYFFLDQIASSSPLAIRHISTGRKVLIALFIVIFFFSFQFMYRNVISLASRETKEKEQSQSEGDYGLFLGGRSEIISSYFAISDSPILGHGSWPKDPKYDKMLYYFLKDAGYKPGSDVSDLIPTHSHLFGSWVEAGILGGVFWIFIFALVVRVLWKLYKIDDSIKYLTVFIALSLMWDIIFSPFGADRRIQQAFYIVVIITAFNAIKAQRGIHQRTKINAN